MTKQRFDTHSTEFGLWLRKIPEIDSSLGYVTTNLDFFWKNYKTDDFMLLEEKRYMSEPAKVQHKIFEQLHHAFQGDPHYKGIHLIQFEYTNPEDGKIYIDHKEISKQQLIEFLTFKPT
jgi:hypothetical protein